MGFKKSMIIVKQLSTAISDEELLKMLGYANATFSGDTTFEECMYPNDKSINLGHYNLNAGILKRNELIWGH